MESLNRLFKYDYLPRSIHKSLYGVIVLIVTSFLPETYQAYRSANLRLSDSYRQYNSMVPEYLKNRPPNFIKHCLKKKFAGQEFCKDDIQCVNHDKGEFVVRSATSKCVKYRVELSIPKCTCESWRRTTYPCKHFFSSDFAVFNFFSSWQFDNLPPDYHNSLIITLNNDDLLVNTSDTPTSRQPSNFSAFLIDPAPQKTSADTPRPHLEENFNTNLTTSSSNSLKCEKLRQQLQEKLPTLKNVSYLVEDMSLIENAITIIDDLLVKLQAGCPKAEGILL